jgi:hypothetical protein
VRAAQRAAVPADELRLDVLERDGDAQTLSLATICSPRRRRAARVSRRNSQPLVVERKKERQYVQLAPGCPNAELAPGDYAKIELRSSCAASATPVVCRGRSARSPTGLTASRGAPLPVAHSPSDAVEMTQINVAA